MSRVGDALLRARGPVTGSNGVGGAAVATPAWVAPLDDAIDKNVWAFEAPTPAPAPTPVPTPTPTPAAALSPAPSPFVSSGPVAVPVAPSDVLDTPTDVASDAEHLINPEVAERIVTSTTIPHAAVEHYRRLAATLHEVQMDRGIRVVMITSAVLGEGKSLTSANLALTLSQSYRRHVLLVDADLRRPTLHDIFTVPSSAGLSDGLQRRRAGAFTTFHLSPTLTLLPAGRPEQDPMASLTSARMKQLIDEARNKFDWIILDTPPVTLMPDAKLLAAMADTVLLVVGAGKSSADVLKQAVKALGRKRVLGTVFNRAEGETDAGYYYER